MRTYATEHENQATKHESTSQQASEASKPEQEASNILTEAAQPVQNAAEGFRETVANTAQSVSETTQDLASAVTSEPPASSAQTTPIRETAERVTQELSTHLYLGNLYFEVSEKAIQDEFSKYGPIVNSKVIYDGRGLSKG